MAQELGKVDKPEVSSFKHSRKILQVPLIYAGKESTPEYLALYEKYWQQAGEMISKLENKLGSVTVVYHESVSSSGEEGLKTLETLNSSSYEIAKERCQAGNNLRCIENKEILEEVMDWERCIMMGFLSEKVARTVYDAYSEASKKRFQQMGKLLDESLKGGEIAVLFIREGHMIQFPQDMDVFSVAPPSLDEIRRWAREQAMKIEK